MDSKSAKIAIGFGFIMIIAMVMFITAMIESNERIHKAQELRKSKLEYQIGDACGMYVVSDVSVKSKVFTNLLHVKTGEKLYFYEEKAVNGFCKHAFNSPEYQLLK